MARADLILTLVRAGASGDKPLLRSTVEALIADERAKRHTVLADRLARAIAGMNGQQPPALSNQFVQPNSQSGRDFLFEQTPRRALSSMVLRDNIRSDILEVIEEHNRADLLRSYGLQPRHRILLAGPPGNGKTSLAEAIAEGLGLPLFSVRYDAIIASYLGETNQRLKRMFDYIRTVPCVLLFDEFDALGKERGDEQETGEIKRVVSSLLLQMDALPSYVIAVAATNHEELLDRAAWRRFQLRLHMPAPTFDELTAFLSHSLRHDFSRDRATQLCVEQLALSSYAEAEDFALDVRRREALSLGKGVLRDVIKERARHWAYRMKAPQDASRSVKAPVDARSARRRSTRKGETTADTLPGFGEPAGPSE